MESVEACECVEGCSVGAVIDLEAGFGVFMSLDDAEGGG